MAALSSTEFAQGAQHFVDVWNTFQDEQAEWVKLSPNLAAVHQVDGYVALSNIPMANANSSAATSHVDASVGLDEQADELLEDDATLVCDSSAALRTYDFHMVYSPTYRVPFLLLRGQNTDGTLLTEEEMAADLPASTAELAGSGSKWMFMTRQDHPYLSEPWSALHPCETAQLMKLLMDEESARPNGTGSVGNSLELRAKRYFLAWFSIAGPVVGLTLRSEAFRC